MNLPTFAARVVPQLDGSPQQGSNCGPATAARHVRFASRGKIRATPSQIRKRMGIPKGPTNIVDQKTAVESHADEFVALGLKPPRLRKLNGVPPDVIRGLLAHGAELSVQIGYHVINAKRPRASGQRSFDTPGKDGHSVAALGLYDRDGEAIAPGAPPHGREFTDMIDPLADGRRPDLARGPQRIPLHLLMEAAAACPIDRKGNLLGAGKVLAGSVRMPPPLTDQPVEGPCAGAEQDRDAALAEVERLRGILRAIAAAATDADDDGSELGVFVGRMSANDGDALDADVAVQPDADATSGSGPDTVGDIDPDDDDA